MNYFVQQRRSDEFRRNVYTFEVFAALLFVELVLWNAGVVRYQFGAALVSFIAVTTWIHRKDLGLLGFGQPLRRESDPSFSIGRILAIASLLAATIMLIAYVYGTLKFRLLHIPGYVLKGVPIQELILQGYLFCRIEKIFRDKYAAICCTAVIFSATHIPNPLLCPVTLFGGVALIWIYERTRSMTTVVAVHSLVGTALMLSVPATLVSMRVGYGFYR